jgi:hypothetical protein
MVEKPGTLTVEKVSDCYNGSTIKPQGGYSDP